MIKNAKNNSKKEAFLASVNQEKLGHVFMMLWMQQYRHGLTESLRL